MKSLAKNTSAQGGIITFFISAMIAVVIALQVAWPVVDDVIYSESAAAGTLTFTGNVSQNETVNVTSGSATYAFAFNIASTGIPAGQIAVNLGAGRNSTATDITTNLTAAINNNATVAALLTATRASATVVTLQADTAGRAGNGIGTTENTANGAWGAATLTGGLDTVTSNMSSASQTLVEQIPLFLVLVLVMVFVKAII